MAVAPSPQRHRRRARRPMGAISHCRRASRRRSRSSRVRHFFIVTVVPSSSLETTSNSSISRAPGSPSPKPHGRSVRLAAPPRHRGSPDRRRGRSRRARIEVALAERPHDHLTTAGVDDDVARHLGDGGRDQRWVRAWRPSARRGRALARAGTDQRLDDGSADSIFIPAGPLASDDIATLRRGRGGPEQLQVHPCRAMATSGCIPRQRSAPPRSLAVIASEASDLATTSR